MKRVIFTLLHDAGSYMLSRNFRLQRIGDLRWLLDNYRLAEVSEAIDEMMVLNVADHPSVTESLLADVRLIARECFIPLAVGGGIRSMEDAQRLLEIGVDKVVMNTSFHRDPSLCEAIADRFGRQFLIQGIDLVRRPDGSEAIVRLKGGHPAPHGVSEALARGREAGAGEILIQSVDRDGTGTGLELSILDEVRHAADAPAIMMGGIGRATHILEGLEDPRIDAVATANLLNFVGDALPAAREMLLREGAPVPRHSVTAIAELRGIVGSGWMPTP